MLRFDARARALAGRLRADHESSGDLRSRVEEIEASNRTLATRYVEVEQLNTKLASLYVASYRLHGTMDRAEVLETLREILINLLGSEEFAIFEREGDGPGLRRIASFGTLADQEPTPSLDEPPLGAWLAGSSPHVCEVDPGEVGTTRRVRACVPLRIGDRVVGGIVVYRLLAHKPTLDAADIELLELLGTHAATALYCSELTSRSREPEGA